MNSYSSFMQKTSENSIKNFVDEHLKFSLHFAMKNNYKKKSNFKPVVINRAFLF